ncbi:MAG: 50S ribosomal protein L5 [Candidatus Phytoplasma stylosanthis]|uniref:50S ribosomal protein L5 n=1 Tax=Candidatus Phytoplasma stylosanthis TaxID=2798314 RepID=UPI002939BCD2|nr:50S ribosomal protein L5 [Candidatus Phytoplasma stylosanthis]MDV3167850.1 50S ribosomal protein L5 [Candidatus Phytoplasma stylosanthis]MDV3170874.1 50S ribosomal protein L5 [Candidatus Phytoplasma stylosanthis]MDV3173500.1 50S ribosomal protein L5 [Candidatus Phytoplasma stylosanthis]MDV3174054.1 50S ribosomal protein L5 [Candidatus Phytoplasma stylosanthis]MDV3202434.1 50S ribosomal protein L5 [Candidatus Phytoplasma stylosanthis]
MKKYNIQYNKQNIFLDLKKIFNFKSIMQIPKIEKIVINMGVGRAVSDVKILDEFYDQLTLISGQVPVITKSKKSISNFKLREGMPIGLKVTLRGMKKQFFLDKLIKIVLPRIRDFRGLSVKSFDGKGNYSLGIKEQIVFPEIDLDKVKKSCGMDICIVTTAKNDSDAKKLLQFYGMPFSK